MWSNQHKGARLSIRAAKWTPQARPGRFWMDWSPHQHQIKQPRTNLKKQIQKRVQLNLTLYYKPQFLLAIKLRF